MKRATSSVKLSWDDYVRLPEDGLRHELLDGAHLVTPTPVRRHQAIVLNVAASIRWHLKLHPYGSVYVAPLDVMLSAHDIVQPDVLYISHERARVVEQQPWVKGAPSLVVEVISPGTRQRDEVVKRRLYERAGVDEYWLVDPDADSVAVLRRNAGRFELASTLRRDTGEVLTTPLLPGWTMTLADVFEE